MARRGLSSLSLQTHLRAILDYQRRDPGGFSLVVAVALAVLLYAPTLGYALVGYDDTWLLQDNWIVQTPSWHSLRTIFFELDVERRLSLAPEYLPVRDLSVMLDYAIWGDWYVGFHLTNIALYLGAIVAWFLALEAFGLDRRVVGLALLLWAVHPAHAESVAWLAERKGLLAMALSGVCAVGFSRFRAGRRVFWLVLAVIAALAAVWSKAHAAFAIGSLAMLELMLPARRVSWRRSLIGLAAIGGVAVAAFVPVALLAHDSSVVGIAAPTGGRAELVLGIHGFYVQLVMMLHRNSVSYPLALHGPSAVDLVIGTVALLVLVAMLCMPRGRRLAPHVEIRAACVLWLFAWLPVSHLLVPLRMVVVADRYMLFPTLGFALLIAATASRVASARARTALVLIMIAASALRSWDAQSNWRDGESLWGRAVASNPDDGGAWSMYAEAVASNGQRERAIAIVREGKTHSRAPRLVMREALLSLEVGDRATGSALMREAASAGEHRAMSNLALLLLEDGASAEALAWARRSVQEVPLYEKGQRNLGKVALAAGYPEEALVAFERAYALQPRSLPNRFNLALALIAVQRNADARPHLEACLADPALRTRAQVLLQRL